MFGSSLSSSQRGPLRLSLVGQNNNSSPSQKKKRKSNTIAGTSLDEENRLQISTNVIANTSNSDLLLDKNYKHRNKSPRIEEPIETNEANVPKSSDHTAENNTPSRSSNNVTMNNSTIAAIDINEHLNPSFIHSDPIPESSECGTEVSSVSERRKWLKSFEKKQAINGFRSVTNGNAPAKIQTRDNDDHNSIEERDTDAREEARESPPLSSETNTHTNSRYSNGISLPVSHHASSVTCSATKPKQRKPAMNRRASSNVMMHSWIGARKEEVKATDDGAASVASLSKWLAADPTSAKKKRHVRRGLNIISKSRQFEKDQENVIMVEGNFSRGAVGNRKKWLQSAFQSSVEEDADDDTCSTFSGYVQSDVGRSTRSYSHYNRQCAQTEIITNDTASGMSVADKKDWLKKAFSEKSEERKKLGYTKAHTDVMHNRGQPRDEAASRAKLMFKERSARKLLSPAPKSSSLKPVPPAESKEPMALISSSSDCHEGTNRVAPEDKATTEPEPKKNTPMKEESNTKPKESIFRSKKVVQISDSVEEDRAPMDFRAARNALVQRSKKNGHKTQVVNKVFLRKKKFEKMEEDNSRRQSKGVGLVLKSSWDIADSSRGRPSTVYEKKYVNAQDIAPKKSFEELP